MIKKILLVALVIWFGASSIRFVDHVVRIATNETKTIFESDDTKRRDQFGQIYDVITYLNRHTDASDEVAMVTSNGEYFYLTRYYLYPKKVVWIQENSAFKNQIYEAIFVDSAFVKEFPLKDIGYSRVNFGTTEVFFKK